MKNYSRYQNLLLILLAFVAGSLVSIATTAVLAHGGDTSKLHSCVDDTTGAMRIVGENDTCPSGEHNVDWDQDAVASVKEKNPPFTCMYRCWFSDYPERFKGKDLTYSIIRQIELINVDMSNTTFRHASLTGSFNDSNLSDTDFRETNTELTFIGATLTNANFSNSVSTGSFENADLTDTNFSNATSSAYFGTANLENTNFSNANLTNAYFTGATNMDTATITGVTWSNTTCPDGTNSDENSNTCIGHLTP